MFQRISLLVLCLVVLACGESVVETKTAVVKEVEQASEEIIEPIVQQVQIVKDSVIEVASELKNPITDAVASNLSESEVPVEDAQEVLVEEVVEDSTETNLTQEEVSTETSQAIQAVQTFLRQREETLHQRIDSRLGRFDEKLTELRQRAQVASEHAKLRVSEQTKGISSKLKATDLEISKMGEANQQELAQVEQQLEQNMLMLEKSLEAFASQFE